MTTCAIVPAFNEGERIAETVTALMDERISPRVLVIDDGSTDNTAAVARGAGAEVERLERNRGKGTAISVGLSRADGDVFLLVDADLGESARRLMPLVQVVQEREADVAVAQFEVPGGFGLAKKTATWGIKRLTGREFKSPLSGQRALSKRAVAAVQPLPRGWGIEVAITVKSLWQGLSVIEVPISLEHRATGRGPAGFAHRGRQCLAVLWTLYTLAGYPLSRQRPVE